MVKLALVQMNSTVGDLPGNAERLFHFARNAFGQGAQLVLTPELSLAGYPPEDLLLRDAFYLACQKELTGLAQRLAEFPNLHVVVGHPCMHDGSRFNAASVLANGRILGSYFKQNLPNDQVFDEKRYFSVGQSALVLELGNRNRTTRFGISICEDVWDKSVPAQAKAAGAEVLLVLNGSPYHMNKQHLRYQVMRDNVSTQGMSLVYANLVGGQDELIFDGNSFVLNSQGQIEAQLKHAQEDMQVIEFAGSNPCKTKKAIIEPELSVEAQVYQALVLGVRDYIGKNEFPGVLLGLSGGVDSALTLAIAVDALGADKVHAVMMPSPYTSAMSLQDARQMIKEWGVHYDEIPVDACFNAFSTALAPKFLDRPADATEENIQARIRGTLLMALSNKFGSIVLTTGNKSEMAVGYCTLYGDMAGGFAVLKDIAKTFVYRLCAYRNSLTGDEQTQRIPERILTRPPSAELRPDQTDQDSLPPYEILDGIVQLYMEQNLSIEQIIAAGYKKEDVDRITYLIKVNEYKRRQSPIGIRVTHRAFGRDWRYPVTSRFRL